MRRIADVAALAWPIALLVLGALTLAQSWDTWAAAGVLAAAAALPLLLVRGVLAVGVSRWAAVVGSIMLLLLGGYLVTADAGLSLREVAQDVVPRLLTSPRPYALEADLLVGPVLLTALASVLCALRVDSPHRVVPLVASGTLYVAGALLAGGDADPHGVVAVLMLVLAIGGWVFLDQHDEPQLRRFRVAGPVALVGVALLACAALVPADDPFDATDLVDPPLADVVATSPLSSVGAWNADPGQPLFRVTGDDVPLRLAVLDVYDGLQWTARPRFAPLGTRADPGLPDGGTVRSATSTIRIENLPAGFVPTPGRPTAIDLTSDADLLVDLGTGSVFDATSSTQSSAEDLTYTVTGVTDAADDADIEAASAPGGDRVAPYLRLPDLPADLAEYAAGVTRGAVTPYQQAVTIQNKIRADGTLSSDAVSGSALYRLQSFLFGADGESGARVGSSEQFASAFAVVARANGLPSRVVVGFRPGTPDADGSREVTGADALAWPEVYFSSVGWVPFSPTPDDTTFVRDEPDQVELPPANVSAGPSSSATADPTPAGATTATSAGRSVPWVFVVTGLVLLVVVLLLLARVARRSRHRRRGAPGDWAEVLDSLHLTHQRPPAHASAAQIATTLDDRIARSEWASGHTGPAGASATLLAERADRAVFGPDAPAGSPTGSRAELRVVRRHIRRSVPLWRRWWWSLDPRVFRRR